MRKVLRGILDSTPGALAACLSGLDGVSVEVEMGNDTLDPDQLAAELATLTNAANRTMGALGSGPVVKYSFTTERYQVFVDTIGGRYLLSLVAERAADARRAQVELNKAVVKLALELGV